MVVFGSASTASAAAVTATVTTAAVAVARRATASDEQRDECTVGRETSTLFGFVTLLYFALRPRRLHFLGDYKFLYNTLRCNNNKSLLPLSGFEEDACLHAQNIMMSGNETPTSQSCHCRVTTPHGA